MVCRRVAHFVEFASNRTVLANARVLFAWDWYNRRRVLRNHLASTTATVICSTAQWFFIV